jgi:RND family efflux transporter MFP subunit
MKFFRPWMILAVVILAAAAWWVFAPGPVATATVAPSVLVSTMKLEPGSLPATVTAYGSVTAGPGAEQTLSTQASGVVGNVAVSLGQSVAAGQVLATLAADAPSVAELRKARDAVSAARAARAHVAALLASHLATNADLAVADQAVGDADGALKALQATGAGRTRTIVAPFAGVVSAVLAAPGSLQPAGSGLVRLIESDGLVAVTGVTPAQAGAIAAGDAARITLLNDAGAVVDGQVALVAAMPDPQSGLQDVSVTPQAALPLGAPVKTVITTGQLNGYVVPRDAVQSDTQGAYVFQLDAGNIAHRVGVRVLGNAGGQSVLAAAGLNAALPLVTVGAYQLDDGVAVRMAGGAGN